MRVIRKGPVGYFLMGLRLLLVTISVARAQQIQVDTKSYVATGWHPWYEVKVDPEDPMKMIVCATEWQARKNVPFGVVYASSDAGKTWSTVLQDTSTSWVTEHSCAFGHRHLAYFVSEASKVIDGETHHDQGTTRLFVSADGGLHWAQTIATGWADYSTSVVNSVSGRLYTFFTSWPRTRDERTIGLLVFSSDGKAVSGPFFDSASQASFNYSVFSSHAVALKSGTVAVLYYGKRLIHDGWTADLGVLRAGQGPEPRMESTVIAHPAADQRNNCDTLSDNSLAYDAKRNRLIVAYVEGCKSRASIMLAFSDDEGQTWTKGVVLIKSSTVTDGLYSTSLIAMPGDALGLLWQEGENRRSGRWLFSIVRQGGELEPPVELSQGSVRYEVSSDSLRTSINQAGRVSSLDMPEASTVVNVFSELNTVWRSIGLVATGDSVLAVWQTGRSTGVHLNAALLSHSNGTPIPQSGDTKEEPNIDVTRQTAVIVDSQQFDRASGTLRLCLAIANRGDTAIRVPINLELQEIRSAVAKVSVADATNGMTDTGAMWNLDSIITGDRLPPRTTSNPFWVAFKLTLPPRDSPSPEAVRLLILRLKVMARNLPTR